MPLDSRYKTSKRHKITSRRHTPRDIVAVGLKYLISTGEHKDLFIQFGMTHTMYLNCLRIGLTVFADVLEFHPTSRVWWNRTEQGLKETSNMTKMFVDIPNVVGMLDGKRLISFNPSDPVLQNRDYNGWVML